MPLSAEGPCYVNVTFVYSGKGSDVPLIYAVDSTNEEDWETDVRLPSSKLIFSFLQVCSEVYEIF